MMQSKTSLRFVLHATQSCIGELIEDCFLTGPGTTSLSNQIYSTAAAPPPLGCNLAEVVTSPLGGLGAIPRALVSNRLVRRVADDADTHHPYHSDE